MPLAWNGHGAFGGPLPLSNASRVQFRPDVCPKRLKPRQLRVLTDLTRFYAWSNLEAHGPFED